MESDPIKVPKKGVIDRDNVYFDISNCSESDMTEFISCTMEVARVSPVLAQIINVSQPEVVGEGKAKQSSEVQLLHRIEHGKVVVVLSCSQQAIEQVIKWMQYHVLDDEFERNCRFPSFAKDKHALEQKVLVDKLCYFDVNFIYQLASGGDKFSDNAPFDPERRSLLYEVIRLADQLQLSALVLVAGKYICSKIADKTVPEVREMLGITADLPLKVEQLLQQHNEQIFSAQPIRDKLLPLKSEN